MGIKLTSKDYMDYILLITKKIESEGEYITGLDAATGDGDHWTNINSGFQKLVAVYDELSALPISDMLKKIGINLMSAVGGSSGVLYGSAYIAAAKVMESKECLQLDDIADLLEAMLKAIMERGNARPGHKTMVDALHPAVNALKNAISNGKSEKESLEEMKTAALTGAAATRDMQSIRGRASYRSDKGVGHLDPGAVTMSYQLECLTDFIVKL